MRTGPRSTWLPAALIAVSIACGPAPVDPNELLESVVKVYCMSDHQVFGTGSGFVLPGGHHVVTNRHVAVTDSGRCPFTRLLTHRDTLEVQTTMRQLVEALAKLPRAEVQWVSDVSDVAILELDAPLDLPGVEFVDASEKFELVRRGDPVWAVGYPGMVSAAVAEYGAKTDAGANVDNGRVTNRQIVEGGGVIQHSATISGGNSGGPLFDACGRVAGINTFGVREGPDYFWAIEINQLLPGLERDGTISHTMSRERCDPERYARQERMGYLGGVAAIAVGALALTLRRGPRERVLRAATEMSRSIRRSRGSAPGPAPAPEPAASPLAADGGAVAVLVGLSGEHAGVELPLDRRVVLGRSAKLAHLVFDAGKSPGVSKRHCALEPDRAQRNVKIEDLYSRYGTFLDTGERIDPARPMVVRATTRIYLGSREQSFEIRFG